MRIPRTLVLALPAGALLITDASSFGTGQYAANSTTRTTPSCGSCHTASPGNVTVSVRPTARSLAAGAQTSVTVTASGPAGTTGGFACDVTAGTLSAGANTTLQNPPTAITHANNSVRSWTFGFNSPAAAGLIELFVVAMGSNGSGSSGDSWAFHGSSSTATTSTPVRLFTNAAGVTPIGESCVGSFGNFPVFGARQAPTLGNANFGLELHGAAPNSAAALLVGDSQLTTPVDLSMFGITGCRAFINPCPSPCQPRVTQTSSGNAQRSEGSVTFPVPIPNNMRLRGQNVFFQSFFADASVTGRTQRFTFSNALRVTVQ